MSTQAVRGQPPGRAGRVWLQRRLDVASRGATMLETKLRIKHMIASHHGEYEFGSPRLPMTPESMALHLLDNLDAKLHNFKQLVEEDLNSQSRWTTFQPSLNRKIFKGGIDD